MRLDRVFIDTNVLLSGLIFHGNEAYLLDLAVRGRIRLVLAETVLEEARRVMGSKFPEHLEVIDQFLALVNYELVPVPSSKDIDRASPYLRDPDDAAVLASIVISQPDVVLTGDKDLLTDAIRELVPIYRCAEYLVIRGDIDTKP